MPQEDKHEKHRANTIVSAHSKTVLYYFYLPHTYTSKLFLDMSIQNLRSPLIHLCVQHQSPSPAPLALTYTLPWKDHYLLNSVGTGWMCCQVDSATRKPFLLVQSGVALPARPSSDSAQDTKCLLGDGLGMENVELAVCWELTVIYSLRKCSSTQQEWENCL